MERGDLTFTEEQMTGFLQEAESGLQVAEFQHTAQRAGTTVFARASQMPRNQRKAHTQGYDGDQFF